MPTRRSLCATVLSSSLIVVPLVLHSTPLTITLPKNQVREQLRAGRGESEVIDFMTQRYGDFVLYKPPLKASTALLWGGPVLLGLLALLLGVRAVRASSGPTDSQR